MVLSFSPIARLEASASGCQGNGVLRGKRAWDPQLLPLVEKEKLRWREKTPAFRGTVGDAVSVLWRLDTSVRPEGEGPHRLAAELCRRTTSQWKSGAESLLAAGLGMGRRVSAGGRPGVLGGSRGSDLGEAPVSSKAVPGFPGHCSKRSWP